MKPPESSYSKPFMQGIYRIVLNEHVQFIQSVDPEISQVKSAVNTCHCKAESLRVNQRNSFFTDTTNSAWPLSSSNCVGIFCPCWFWFVVHLCLCLLKPLPEQVKGYKPSRSKPTSLAMYVLTPWPSTLESLGCCKVWLSMSVLLDYFREDKAWNNCIWLTLHSLNPWLHFCVLWCIYCHIPKQLDVFIICFLHVCWPKIQHGLSILLDTMFAHQCNSSALAHTA